jgi:hypothetical protein
MIGPLFRIKILSWRLGKAHNYDMTLCTKVGQNSSDAKDRLGSLLGHKLVEIHDQCLAELLRDCV